jgi:hypothetical protein
MHCSACKPHWVVLVAPPKRFTNPELIFTSPDNARELVEFTVRTYYRIAICGCWVPLGVRKTFTDRIYLPEDPGKSIRAKHSATSTSLTRPGSHRQPMPDKSVIQKTLSSVAHGSRIAPITYRWMLAISIKCRGLLQLSNATIDPLNNDWHF